MHETRGNSISIGARDGPKKHKVVSWGDRKKRSTKKESKAPRGDTRGRERGTEGDMEHWQVKGQGGAGGSHNDVPTRFEVPAGRSPVPEVPYRSMQIGVPHFPLCEAAGQGSQGFDSSRELGLVETMMGPPSQYHQVRDAQAAFSCPTRGRDCG